MPFVERDSVSIHYEVEGEGEPLVLIAGTGFDMSFWEPMMSPLEGFRILRLDNRGAGLSSAPDERYSIGEMADDTAAAMEAAGFHSAHVYGASMGSLIAQELGVRYPERVRSLILGATSAGVTMIPTALPLAPLLLRPARYEPEEAFRRSAAYLSRRGVADPETVFPGHALSARNPAGYRRQLQAQLRYSSLRKMRRIDAPTLVLHGERDRMVPPVNAWLAARLIPRAHLHLIRGAGHLYHLDNPEDTTRATLDFLLGAAEQVLDSDVHAVQEEAVPRTTGAVLVTDIVDSTAHLARLGDAGWLPLLQQHDAILRDCVARFDGAEVKTTGDGLIAIFEHPAAAIRSAALAITETRKLGIELRAGVHWGECEISDGDIHGVAVHAASRVADTSGPGEVHVSQVVVELCDDPALAFTACGEHTLKGLPGEWPLFEVKGHVAELDASTA
jgi:pimeloyl-ACP methyl ester carboxylesterase